jgi:hypothetical protein
MTQQRLLILLSLSNLVILSAVTASRSEVVTQSKAAYSRHRMPSVGVLRLSMTRIKKRRRS